MRSLTGLLTVLVVFVALLGISPGLATTIVSLEFDQIVKRSDVVVEGTVVDIRNQYTGTDLQRSKTRKDKKHVAPESLTTDLGRVVATDDDSGQPAAPSGLGVEGGRMLFTEVTLAVGTEIVGSTGSTVTFRVAGGSDENGSVVVLGMPRFEIGERYVVFLRPGFETTATPIVGVNQGFFQVARQTGTGQEILLNADGDILLGVESNRVVARYNPQGSTGPQRRLVQPPTPSAGVEIESRTSPRVLRYWSSDEPPMTLDNLVSVIRSAKEEMP